jgi:hypothetical protein
VRETVHGVEIGLRAFPKGGTGALLASAVLASSESFAWLLFSAPTREFSNRLVLRNLATAGAYFALTQYPEIWPEWVDRTPEGVKIWAAIAYAAITFLDMIFFRVKGRNGFDVTLLTYIGWVFKYSGDK